MVVGKDIKRHNMARFRCKQQTKSSRHKKKYDKDPNFSKALGGVPGNECEKDKRLTPCGDQRTNALIEAEPEALISQPQIGLI
ncbi:hypothetical protein RRG08_064014 [Elysia crispata]|uniref:Uncharacterized protein n=1 Tax=Elysia crispata TaxID=231223 RepID=A0AAE1CXI2_9GAST|nr:hypothetical protein RRG08_064014 [Elysia crispata]